MIDPAAAFEKLLDIQHLRQVLAERVGRNTTRGIDRTSPQQLSKRFDAEADLIRTRCLEGTYRFAPYLESLRIKSSTKLPRRVSIPTARDRIVLHVLKEVLHDTFPESVERRLPNQFVREILDAIKECPNAVIVRADIRQFYDDIPHESLLNSIEDRLPPPVTRLIERAIRNPTRPLDERATFDNSRLRPLGTGVPQGTAISNILAEIYLREFDSQVQVECYRYFRYVDDILGLVTAEVEEPFYAKLGELLASIGLTLADDKHQVAYPGDRVDYLGYELQGNQVSVRRRTLDGFTSAITAAFAAYRHGTHRVFHVAWIKDAATRKQIFLDELNERITGAVSGNRRYGWVFYFSELTDMRILYRLDRMISQLWKRFFTEPGPQSIKRFVRAHYEARYRQLGSYIHNYNSLSTVEQKRAFLNKGGHLNPEGLYTDEQINDMFVHVREQRLSRLEADVGFVS